MQIGNNCIFLSCKLSHRAHLNLYRLYIHPHLLTTLHHPQSTSTLISSPLYITLSPHPPSFPHQLHHPQSTSTLISSPIYITLSPHPPSFLHQLHTLSPHPLTISHHLSSLVTTTSAPMEKSWYWHMKANY